MRRKWGQAAVVTAAALTVTGLDAATASASWTPGVSLVSSTPSGEQFVEPAMNVSITRDGQVEGFTADGAFLHTAGGTVAAEGAQLSGDGRYVVFTAESEVNGFWFNHVLVQDLADGTIEPIPDPPSDFGAYDPALSYDGRFVAFHESNYGSSDPNQPVDVYDRATGQLSQIIGPDWVDIEGNGSTPAISDDGLTVAFDAQKGAYGVSAIWVCKRASVSTPWSCSRIAESPFDAYYVSSFASVSANGRWVAFASQLPDLVSGDTNGVSDVFVYDSVTSTMRRVSVNAHGVQGNGGSYGPAISADGAYVAFSSDATNLVRGDTNGVRDVFLVRLHNGSVTRLSVGPSRVQANGPSCVNVGSGYGVTPCVAIDGRGQAVSFESDATNLVPGDNNGLTDVFVARR